MNWTYSLDQLANAIGAQATGHQANFSSVSTDTRSLAPGDVFFALSGENYDGAKFVPDAFKKGAIAAVTTVSSEAGPCLIVDDPLRALQTFAAHHRAQYTIPVIALTGSCGKTTTKDLMAALLSTRYRVIKTQGNLNNEIGCPLSLLRIGPDTDIAVIEMGANHPGEIAALCALAKPTEAAITLVAPAHLEGFGSIENVACAKGEIIEGLSKDGLFYVNVNDPWCVSLAEPFAGRKVLFGNRGDVVVQQAEFIAPGRMRLSIAPIGELELPVLSRAHISNVLLAVAVALQHGVTEFQAPLQNAFTDSTRCKILTIGPLTVIDDTYNANPTSMAASIDALANWPTQGARFAALGDMLELGDAAQQLHQNIGTLAGTLGISHLFAKGPHASDIINGARLAHVPHAEVCDDPNDIAKAISAAAKQGDVLLVKGSRGMKMERVIEALSNMYEKGL